MLSKDVGFRGLKLQVLGLGTWDLGFPANPEPWPDTLKLLRLKKPFTVVSVSKLKGLPSYLRELGLI